MASLDEKTAFHVAKPSVVSKDIDIPMGTPRPRCGGTSGGDEASFDNCETEFSDTWFNKAGQRGGSSSVVTRGQTFTLGSRKEMEGQGRWGGPCSEEKEKTKIGKVEGCWRKKTGYSEMTRTFCRGW